MPRTVFGSSATPVGHGMVGSRRQFLLSIGKIPRDWGKDKTPQSRSINNCNVMIMIMMITVMILIMIVAFDTISLEPITPCPQVRARA